MGIKKLLILTIFAFSLIFSPTVFANGDQDSCSTGGDSFESLILLILDTLDEQQQDRVLGHSGDHSKEPHLFLPPFEALDGIGIGLPMADDLLATTIQPIPIPVIPVSGITNNNLTLFGVNNACDFIEPDFVETP